MRYYGFKGLHVYITTVDDLDAFVSKFIDSGNTSSVRCLTSEGKLNIIPTILTNTLEYADESTPAEEDKEDVESSLHRYLISYHIWSVTKYSLAVACLHELSHSRSAITIQSLLSAVFEFVQGKDLWYNEDFMHECLGAIAVKVSNIWTMKLSLF